MVRHLDLFVEGTDPPGTQPVEVEECPRGRFRVLCSPGFVEGIAAGDVVRVTDQRLGLFEVVERGGNVALKWAASSKLADALIQATDILSSLSARIDGALDFSAVWTVPAAVGFPAMEERMERVVALRPGSTGWYGDVYHEQGRPLNWW